MKLINSQFVKEQMDSIHLKSSVSIVKKEIQIKLRYLVPLKLEDNFKIIKHILYDES